MFSERALVSIARAAAAGRGGHIFRKGLRSDEYHVLSDGYAVVVMDDGELVVVTQMHQHADYWNDSVYEKVDRIPGGRDD